MYFRTGCKCTHVHFCISLATHASHPCLSSLLSVVSSPPRLRSIKVVACMLTSPQRKVACIWWYDERAPVACPHPAKRAHHHTRRSTPEPALEEPSIALASSRSVLSFSFFHLSATRSSQATSDPVSRSGESYSLVSLIFGWFFSLLFDHEIHTWRVRTPSCPQLFSCSLYASYLEVIIFPF